MLYINYAISHSDVQTVYFTTVTIVIIFFLCATFPVQPFCRHMAIVANAARPPMFPCMVELAGACSLKGSKMTSKKGKRSSFWSLHLE